MASGRIGQMLGKAKMSPADAEARNCGYQRRGGHAVVADMTPGLQAQAGALSKKANVPGSNDMIAKSRERLVST
jgi:hypothetical protein